MRKTVLPKPTRRSIGPAQQGSSSAAFHRGQAQGGSLQKRPLRVILQPLLPAKRVLGEEGDERGEDEAAGDVEDGRRVPGESEAQEKELQSPLIALTFLLSLNEPVGKGKRRDGHRAADAAYRAEGRAQPRPAGETEEAGTADQDSAGAGNDLSSPI